MQLKVTRNGDGSVVITDPRTGRSETIQTDVLLRPADVRVAEASSLPSHQWARVDGAA